MTNLTQLAILNIACLAVLAFGDNIYELVKVWL